jgi:hypothetical protein
VEAKTKKKWKTRNDGLPGLTTTEWRQMDRARTGEAVRLVVLLRPMSARKAARRDTEHHSSDHDSQDAGD